MKTHAEWKLEKLLKLDKLSAKILNFIDWEPNITTSELTQKVSVSKQKVRSVCKSLVASGLAEEFNDVNGTWGSRGIQYVTR